MNLEQVLSLLRTLLQFGAGIAVGRGYIDNDTAMQIVAGLVALAATGWSLYTRTNKSIVAAAAEVPGVQKIAAPAFADKVSSPKVVAH